MNWCTMMCRQCRFMSSACVLSAASRIWNSRFLEGLFPLSATAPPPRASRRPVGTHELPAVHSAQSRSSPGSACSTPAAGCCRSRNSRGPQTGSWGLVKELPAQGACPPATCPSPRGGCSWSPRPRRDRGNLSCLLPAQNKETHPDTRRWTRAPIQLALYTDSEVLRALSRPEKIPESLSQENTHIPICRTDHGLRALEVLSHPVQTPKK